MLLNKVSAKTVVTEGGRIVIPSNVRKALNIHKGDELLLKVEDNELHITTLKNAIQQSQQLIKKYNKNKINLTKALFDSRKEDASDE